MADRYTNPDEKSTGIVTLKEFDEDLYKIFFPSHAFPESKIGIVSLLNNATNNQRLNFDRTSDVATFILRKRYSKNAKVQFGLTRFLLKADYLYFFDVVSQNIVIKYTLGEYDIVLFDGPLYEAYNLFAITEVQDRKLYYSKAIEYLGSVKEGPKIDLKIRHIEL